MTYCELKSLFGSVFPVQRDVKGTSVDTLRRVQLPVNRLSADACALDRHETSVEDDFRQTGKLGLKRDLCPSDKNRALEIDREIKLGVLRCDIFEVGVGVDVSDEITGTGTHCGKADEEKYVQRKLCQGYAKCENRRIPGKWHSMAFQTTARFAFVPSSSDRPSS